MNAPPFQLEVCGMDFSVLVHLFQKLPYSFGSQLENHGFSLDRCGMDKSLYFILFLLLARYVPNVA